MNCPADTEHLLAFLDGDLPPAEQRGLADHVAACPDCQRQVAELRATDQALTETILARPPDASLLRVRQALHAATAAEQADSDTIMTLEEAAAFLKIPNEALADLIDDLPVFELAGRIRVRKTRLLAWIKERERAFAQQRAQAWTSTPAARWA